MSRGDLQEMDVKALSNPKPQSIVEQQKAILCILLQITFLMVKVPLKILVVLPLRTLKHTDDNILTCLKTPTATIKQVKDVMNKQNLLNQCPMVCT